jgi:cytochrome c peroxidase
MKQPAVILACVALAIGALRFASGPPEPLPSFSHTERQAILAHGPWPPAPTRDPSNRVSGDPAAIALGRQLFFDQRLSADGQRSCATCHNPASAFQDGRVRSIGTGQAVVDRNAIALVNLRLNRWFGWTGAADSLWAQSIRPVLDDKELGLTAEMLRDRLAADAGIAGAYAKLFGARPAAHEPERVLTNAAKAMAAFQETIVTGRTPFDDFRDALQRGDTTAMARYPSAAQRGLKFFVGRGQCTTCHFGPNFTNGEFDDVGVPYFADAGRVDQGRYGGIAALAASQFTLLGRFSDDASASAGLQTRHVEQQHRNWGEFRVPSLRNVARTAPYMHNGSLATLEDVVRHYSEVSEERLHGEEGARLVRPLHLTPQERADLVSFLTTLTSDTPAMQ